jgi:excisionase family DNA binding protein
MADTERNEVESLWTDEQVAAYLQVSVGTVQKWAKQGRIPVRKAGVLNRFDRREIEQWTRPVEPEPDSEAAA